VSFSSFPSSPHSRTSLFSQTKKRPQRPSPLVALPSAIIYPLDQEEEKCRRNGDDGGGDLKNGGEAQQ